MENGVVSVLGNILPNDMSTMVKSFLNGNIEKATKLQLDTLNLTSAIFCEVNPIPIKEACNMLGFNCGIPRLPLVELTDAGKQRLKQAMTDYGLLN